MDEALRHTRLLLSALAFVALACDPNVVIGAKWNLAEGATAPIASGSGGGGVAGTASGSGGSEAVELGGSGGETTSSGGVAAEAGAADAGAPGTVSFHASNDDGNLAEWDEGPDMDAGGYYSDIPEEQPKYSDEQQHSGAGSVKVTIDTSTGSAPIARLYRRISSEQGYYSAWFYLNEDHTPSEWWSIFLFRAHKERSASIDLWDVDLVRVDGRLSISIYDHQRKEVIDVPSKPVIPVRQWFQIEAFLEYGAGKPSRLDYWLNGEPVLTLTDLKEAPPGEPMYWIVGNGASQLSPAVSTLYVDDAIISSVRVGP